MDVIDAKARAPGREREEASTLAAPAQMRGNTRFRSCVAVSAGVALSLCLCVLAVPGGRHGELEEVKRARAGRRVCTWSDTLVCT